MKQGIIEFTIALGLVWSAVFAFGGCFMDQAEAYKIISNQKSVGRSIAGVK